MATATANNRPPHKWQAAAIIDYDSNQSADAPFSTKPTNNTTNSNISKQQDSQTMALIPNELVMELALLKTKITQLKMIIAKAVDQIAKTVESLHASQSQPMPQAMETGDEPNSTSTLNNTTSIPSQPPDLHAIILELKNKIASANNETHAILQQYLPPIVCTNTSSSSVT